jgi:hypothetical protein
LVDPESRWNLNLSYSSTRVGFHLVSGIPYETHSSNTPPRDIVYLTADARGDKELDELDWSPNTIYVLGGIVDRNRMTNRAYLERMKQGIKQGRCLLVDCL